MRPQEQQVLVLTLSTQGGLVTQQGPGPSTSAAPPVDGSLAPRQESPQCWSPGHHRGMDRHFKGGHHGKGGHHLMGGHHGKFGHHGKGGHHFKGHHHGKFGHHLMGGHHGKFGHHFKGHHHKGGHHFKGFHLKGPHHCGPHRHGGRGLGRSASVPPQQCGATPSGEELTPLGTALT